MNNPLEIPLEVQRWTREELEELQRVVFAIEVLFRLDPRAITASFYQKDAAAQIRQPLRKLVGWDANNDAAAEAQAAEIGRLGSIKEKVEKFRTMMKKTGQFAGAVVVGAVLGVGAAIVFGNNRKKEKKK